MSDRVTVRAPGKAIVCGEYAVLDGAPAISVAIDRYVHAEDQPEARPDGAATSPFVAAALAHAARALPSAAPLVEQLRRQIGVVSAELYDDGKKIGLGSSAAVTAAVVGLVFAKAGHGLDDKARLFAVADAAHAEAQGVAGSGIDVATSVYGGAIHFQRARGEAHVRPLAWPEALRLSFVFAGQSASTPTLIARIRALATRDPATHHRLLDKLRGLATLFALAVEHGDAERALQVARDWQPALAALGHAADAPIVTPFFDKVARIAEAHGAAAKPSGAGGGDLGVILSIGDSATRAIRAALASVDIHVLPLCGSGPARGLSLETRT